jgi:hypothetical protein
MKNADAVIVILAALGLVGVIAVDSLTIPKVVLRSVLTEWHSTQVMDVVSATNPSLLLFLFLGAIAADQSISHCYYTTD